MLLLERGDLALKGKFSMTKELLQPKQILKVYCVLYLRAKSRKEKRRQVAGQTHEENYLQVLPYGPKGQYITAQAARPG